MTGPFILRMDQQRRRRQVRYERVAYIAAAMLVLGGVFIVAVLLTVLMMELAQHA